MSYVSQTILRRELTRIVGQSQRVIDAAYAIAKSRVESAHEKMLNSFEGHPVTQEIEAKQSNTSNTLGGRGNLFGFIGFESESEPLADLRDLLRETVSVRRTSRGARYLGDRIIYDFLVFHPGMSDVERVTPMPGWEPGSWGKKIEKPGGISGLGQYIYWKIIEGKPDVSRSTIGTQAKGNLRADGFKPIVYMSEIIQNFKAQIT